MYIDTHCHFDALEFDRDRQNLYTQILANNIIIICPSIDNNNFAKVIDLGSKPNIYFTLGIHPLYAHNTCLQHLQDLERKIISNFDNPKFLGIGEIGLDGMCSIDFNQQIFVYEQQLKLANKFALPVMLHVRKSQDQVLKYLRKYNINSGIAHAFNGSMQQANQYIAQGFKLGFGGNITFERALQIRRLAINLDLDNILLETDAPDIPPSWDYKQRNTPLNIIKITHYLCNLRNLNLELLQNSMLNNIRNIFNKISII